MCWKFVFPLPEDEWLKSELPREMLVTGYCGPVLFDERKFLHFGVACCRRIWDLLVDEETRAAVDAIGLFADDRESETNLGRIARAAVALSDGVRVSDYEGPLASGHLNAIYAVSFLAHNYQRDSRVTCHHLGGQIDMVRSRAAAARSLASGDYEAEETRRTRPNYKAENAAQAELLREIVGNPYRPVSIDPSWLTNDVRKVAWGIDLSNRFDGLPSLGEALEAAGCDDPEILEHCRRPGGHVRGCWVLDEILGWGGPFGVCVPEPSQEHRTHPAKSQVEPGDPPGIWQRIRRLVDPGFRSMPGGIIPEALSLEATALNRSGPVPRREDPLWDRDFDG